MRVIDLTEGSGNMIDEVAQIVVDGFANSTWPDLPSAVSEVRQSFHAGRISRVAIDGSGRALGWIGGIRQYAGHTWELHPLVVKPAVQRRGIGTALVADFEQCVLAQGGKSVMLGSDDETNATSLGGVDLYPDVTGHIREIRNLRHHPFEFYLGCGYVIVGVIPDANGPGKPDILMSKRLAS